VSRDHCRVLLATITEGFAYGRIVCDDAGRPSDFVFLQVNEAFEEISSHRELDVVGKSAREVAPELAKLWTELCGNVALSGKPARLECELVSRHKHLEVRVFSPGKGEFAAVLTDATSRKQMENDLREKVERYRLIVENSHDLVCELDRNGCFLYLSPNYPKVLGYDCEELLGMNAFLLVHSDDLAKVQARFALPEGQEAFRYKHKNGSWLWLESTGRFFTTADGEPRAVIMSRDITERVAADERLRQLSRAVEQSPASVVITDITGRIEYVNPRFSAMTGYSRDEAIGQNPRMLKSGEHPPEKYKQLWETISTGREWRGEFHNKKKNGELYWESASISPLHDAGGKITHFIGVKEDITQRKRAEEALHESEARFRTICEASPLGIVLADCDGNTIYANDATCRIAGAAAGELAGRGWEQALHSGDRERVISEWRRIQQTNEPFQSERRYLHKDGKVIWARLTCAPVIDHGKVRGYMGLVEDITERKQMDEQLRRSQRIESIGTLAGGVAHDLNNILTPILMAAPILIEMLPPGGRDLMLTVEEAAQRGADIVKQVLTFARGIEGERISLQLRHIVKEVQKITHETFPRSIVIRDEIPRDLWMVTGDSTQLHQVLLNLAINARDAMPDGGTITISCENADVDENYAAMVAGTKPGRYVILSVTDTGTGIAPENLEHIFEPFFTTKGVGKGTGLGLSTVLGIVKSHGGCVKVYSEPGLGSTFKLYLPASLKNVSSTRSRQPQTALARGNGEWILLVDDEAAVRKVTEALLQRYGYNVLAAADGIEALSLYAKHRHEIQLVLTDIMMPDLDGVALVRALRKMSPRMLIISSTGQADEARQMELTQLGVRAFLRKPYPTGELLRVVDETLSASRH